MAVSLKFRDGRFVCHLTYKERCVAKDAGFRFDLVGRVWYTPFHSVAARLRDYADDATKKELEAVLVTVTPWSAPLRVPPDLTLKDFQPDAIRFALERNKSYLALDPGLGKTIIAATIAATLKTWGVVYICPPFLVLNTLEEFRKWAPSLGVSAVTAKTDLEKCVAFHDVMIVPDSIITRKSVVNFIERYASSSAKTLLIVDEAHRFKSKDAQRSRSLYGKNLGKFTTRSGLVSLFDKVVLMSGTPMPNRPLELYHMLFKIAPETIDFMSEFDFGVKYCAGVRTPHGWDFSGASDVAGLARRVIYPSGPFMYRLKKDKLDLPPKTEETLIVGKDMSPKVAKITKEIFRKYWVEDLMKAAVAERLGKYEGELHLATYRRLLATEKVPFTVEYVSNILESSTDSVIVFALHKEAIAELEKDLYKYEPITITGSVSMPRRHELVKEFQTNKNRRLFIGNILAAGTGLTLTKASRVLMHEFHWTPGDNDQATDRAHRIGQTKSVLVQYVVHRDSVDKAVIETILKKREATRHI